MLSATQMYAVRMRFPRRRRRGPIEGPSRTARRVGYTWCFHGADAVAQLKARLRQPREEGADSFHGADAVAQLKVRDGFDGAVLQPRFHGGDAVAQMKQIAAQEPVDQVLDGFPRRRMYSSGVTRRRGGIAPEKGVVRGAKEVCGARRCRRRCKPLILAATHAKEGAT